MGPRGETSWSQSGRRGEALVDTRVGGRVEAQAARAEAKVGEGRHKHEKEFGDVRVMAWLRHNVGKSLVNQDTV